MRTRCHLIFLAIFYIASVSASAAEDMPLGIRDLFTGRCVSCHKPTSTNDKAKAKVSDILNISDLIRQNKIVPGKPDQSSVYTLVRDDKMPDGAQLGEALGGRDPLLPSEKEKIRTWIASLDQPPSVSASTSARPFMDDTAIFNIIFTDISKQKPQSVANFRYLSLVNEYNDPSITAADLEVFRQAITKAVNSLTLKPDPISPVPVDPAATIFRINIQVLGWDKDIWDRMAAKNPYVRFNDNVAYRAIAGFLQTSQPVVRADWFAASAMQPPAYYDFLQIPKTVDALERTYIGEPAIEDLAKRKDTVSCIGFRQSGVSQSNRMIERHQAPIGSYYWRSYDFRAVNGAADTVHPTAAEQRRRDIFRFPIGPGKGDNNEDGFLPDGGEIIFGLPNGLQGYMLVNAFGDRIDKGPDDIVRNNERSARRGEVIVDGISCVGCHSEGMRTATDDLLGSVEGGTFDSAIVQQVQLLNDRAQGQNYLGQDSGRFINALRRLSTPPKYTYSDHNGADQEVKVEQLTRLVDHFELDDILLDQAAAELGVTSSQLRNAIARSPDPTEQALLDGRSVSRASFQDDYDEFARKLGLIKNPVDYRSPDAIKLSSVVDSVDKNLKQALNERDQAIGGKADAETEKQSLLVRLAALQDQYNALNNQDQNINNKLRASYKLIDELTTQTKAEENKTNSLTARLAELQQQLSQDNARPNPLQSDVEYLKQKIANLTVDGDNAKGKLSQEVSRAQALQQDLNNKNAELESKNNGIADLNRKLQETAVGWLYVGKKDALGNIASQFKIISKGDSSLILDPGEKPVVNDVVAPLYLNQRIRRSLPLYDAQKNPLSPLPDEVGRLNKDQTLTVAYTAETLGGGYWIGVKLPLP